MGGPGCPGRSGRHAHEAAETGDRTRAGGPCQQAVEQRGGDCDVVQRPVSTRRLRDVLVREKRIEAVRGKARQDVSGEEPGVHDRNMCERGAGGAVAEQNVCLHRRVVSHQQHGGPGSAPSRDRRTGGAGRASTRSLAVMPVCAVSAAVRGACVGGLMNASKEKPLATGPRPAACRRPRAATSIGSGEYPFGVVPSKSIATKWVSQKSGSPASADPKATAPDGRRC